MAPFATPEAFSQFVKGKIAVDDPRVEPALAGVSAAVRRVCGWHVAPSETVTETYDGPGGTLLELPTLHMTDVASLTIGGTLIDPSEYEWSKIGFIRSRHFWTERYRTIEVTYTHGYELEDAADLVELTKSLAARHLSSPMGATREQAGMVSIAWGSGAGSITPLENERAVLDYYRLG